MAAGLTSHHTWKINFGSVRPCVAGLISTESIATQVALAAMAFKFSSVKPTSSTTCAEAAAAAMHTDPIAACPKSTEPTAEAIQVVASRSDAHAVTIEAKAARSCARVTAIQTGAAGSRVRAIAV
jgi:hypothetical protein